MRLNKSMVFTFSSSRDINSVNLQKNYYKILNVQIKDDQKSIKNEYLKLVKTLHPDVNPKGKQKFRQVQQAYEVLSSKQLKYHYDSNRNNQQKQKPFYGNDESYQQKNDYKAYSYDKTSDGAYYSKNQYNFNQDYFKRNYKRNFYRAYSTKQKEPNQENTYQSYDDYINRKEQSSSYQKQSSYYSKFKRYTNDFYSQKQKEYQKLTPEQIKMKDKLKAMRGFTSGYNVMWKSQNIRYKNTMNSSQSKEFESQSEQIGRIIPQRVINFYSLIKSKLLKLKKNKVQ